MQSLLVAQTVQLLAVQTYPDCPPVQSVATRQFPVAQRPDRQSWPAPHWPSDVQSVQA
jgi:hypothetical protein